MPKRTIILDSTQLDRFYECPELWNLANNELLEPNDAYKRALDMGSYGHLILENYYKFTAEGARQQDAISKALDLPIPERLKLEPEDIAIIKDKLLVYSFTYLNDSFIIQDPNCVELGFSHLLYEDDERRYILEGKIDHYRNYGPSVGTYNGLKAIADHKFQLKAHDLYTKKIQFKNYALITRANMVIINYIRLTKKVDGTTFKRVPVPFSSIELDLWQERLIQMFRKVELETIEVEKTGRPYEHRWNSCESKYGYPCQYTPICESTTMVEIEMTKKVKYHQIEAWRPW